MRLPLPDELVGLIFNYLDIPSLLRCMRVCKLFHSIVSGSTRLSYKIELFASYMEDNELSPMDVATRFNLLREHNRVWNNMEWPSSGSIPMLDSYWEFSGGVFAQVAHQNEIFFVQLPCKLKGIAETSWSAPFNFIIRDFTLDNSQDLLVLIELVSNFPNISCKVHLRTLSGNHHPGADIPQITHELGGLHPGLTFLILICGHHVAILYYDPFNIASQNFFTVWNWRTGRREVVSNPLLKYPPADIPRDKYICTPEFRSFAFMTEDLILAGIVATDTEPTLRVLSIAACVNPIHSLEAMPCIYELHYPECSGSTEQFSIRSQPTPYWRPPPGSVVPFYTSRKDFIFTISVCHSSEDTVLIVPLSTLLSEIERLRHVSCRDVAWKDWGLSGARRICREPDETWVRYTYGMKFIHSSPLEARRQVARVYDFNPYAARKYAKSTINSSISWRPLVAKSEPTQCQVCGEEIITTLPGRIADLKLGNLHGAGWAGWETVMIGEDHILMVQPDYRQYGYMAM